MPVTLTKIINGKLVVSDDLTNEQAVKCPRCEQTYRLGYSDNEWNKVKDWIWPAETAIRKDHDLRHEAATIPLEWRGIRRRELDSPAGRILDMAEYCAFCTERATTREHLWDDWVSKLLGEKNRYIIRRDMQGRVRHWKTVGLNEKALVLCDDCNNVWGNDIGAKTKGVVASMITDGVPTKLNESDIEIIATYSLMKAFVCDYMQTDVESFYSPRDRYAFRADLTFPRGVQIWLAWTAGDLHGVFKGAYGEAPLKTPSRYQIYVFTISLGQFVIQVASSRWIKKSHRRHAVPPRLTPGLLWSRFSIPVWPKCDFPVSWPPPSQLESESLDTFVERWRSLRREG